MPQSLAKLLAHIVFSSKNRRPLILPSISNKLYTYISGIAKSHKTRVHEIGGVENHVHILIDLPRTIAFCDLMEEIKKGSSKWIKTQGNEFRDFSWQSGYGGFSIGQSSIVSLRKYIKNQQSRHKKISFQDEYRLLLKKYAVDYDERYVWD